MSNETSEVKTGLLEGVGQHNSDIPQQQQHDANKDTTKPAKVEPDLDESSSQEPARNNGQKGQVQPLTEEPKVLFSHSRRKAWRSLLIQTPAVSMTIAMLGLYIAKVSWAPPGPSNTILSALQYAAKAHEICIGMSMSAIVFHRFQYELISMRGLPLGLLGAPYQLGSIEYFVSSEFRTALTWHTKQRVRHIFTILLLVAGLASAILAGPSSAIVIIPKQDWWPAASFFGGRHDRSDNGTAVVSDMFIAAPYGDLFPQHVTDFGGGSVGSYCNELSNIQCLASGWPYIYSDLTTLFQLQPEDSDSKDPGNILSANVSIPATFGSRQLFGQVRTFPVDNGEESPELESRFEFSNSVAQAVVAADFVSSALSWQTNRLQQNAPFLTSKVQLQSSSDASQAWKQPNVYLQCQYLKLLLDSESSTQANMTFPQGLDASFTIALDDFLSPLWKECNAGGCPTPNITFMNWTNQIPFPVSATSVTVLDLLNSTLGETLNVDVQFEVCYAKAFWADFQAELNNTALASVLPWDTKALDRSSLQANKIPDLGTLITIDSADLNSPNFLSASIVFPDDVSTETATLGTAIAGQCSAFLSCSSFSLAMFMADALSKYQSLHDYVFRSTAADGQSVFMDTYNSDGVTSPNVWLPINDTNKIRYVESFTATNAQSSTKLDDTSLFTKVPMSLHEQVFGYRFGDTLVILAWVVLLAHVAVVLAHSLIILLGKPWSSKAWSELGEFIAFVLQSSPSPHIANVSAGMENSKAWKLTAAVIESTLGNNLQLVLADTIGRTNGQGDSEEMEVPRPDVKYN